jgi:ABC-type nitrate/sulfonate/bicarbonate transport system substrate-binding protein
VTSLDQNMASLDSIVQDPPDVGSNSSSRRTFLLRGAGAAAALSATGLLAACGSSSDTTATPAPKAADAGFTASSGSSIPAVDVKFAMWPYGDTTIGVIGMEKGWFGDVGITLPNKKETRIETQVQQELLNKQLDIGSGYAPNTIQTYAKAPNLKMIHLQNSYIGNYAMANPATKAKKVKDFLAQGQDFNTAFANTIGQMKGKRVALSDAGANKAFFNTILQMAKLSPKDFDLTVVADVKIVQLAKAGKIDYAFPAGAAQSVEILNSGFYRTAGILDMVDGLPHGDPNAVNGIGHAGLQADEKWVADNMETTLRFMSVFYRIIDAVQNDPNVLQVSLPTLSSAAGVDISLKDAKRIFVDFYGTVNFEDTAKLLEDPKYNLYYETVYKSQIAAAKAGGVVPKSTSLTPDDMIIHKKLYTILVDLKKKYDDILAAKKPTGALATKAATQYTNRNYLDAYRMINAAAKV